MVPRAEDQGRAALKFVRAGLAAALLAGAGAAAQADSFRVCDPPDVLSAEQKDRLFRFGAAIKAELDQSGQRVALVSRSGLDLARFNVRYSHAGYSLKHSPDTSWAVRQLYYACDEKQPRIFDQGMLAFVMGMNEADLGYVSVVLLPEATADEVERSALSNRQALQLLSATYSANAYPFSLRYQNCNQWVLELLAAAQGRLTDGVGGTEGAHALRGRAQAWLQQQGYVPSVMDVGWRVLMWATAFVPWLHNDDHPAQDQAQKIYRVSMPTSIEGFVQARLPGATRVEFCHTDRHVVVHRGWTPVAEGCVPGEGDTVIPFD